MDVEWRLEWTCPELRRTRPLGEEFVTISAALADPKTFLGSEGLSVESFLGVIPTVRLDGEILLRAEPIIPNDFLLGLLGYFGSLLEGGLFLGWGSDESCFVISSSGKEVSMVETDLRLFKVIGRDFGSAFFYRAIENSEAALENTTRRWGSGIRVDIRSWLEGVAAFAREFADVLDLVSRDGDAKSVERIPSPSASLTYVDCQTAELAELFRSLADENLKSISLTPKISPRVTSIRCL